MWIDQSISWASAERLVAIAARLARDQAGGNLRILSVISNEASEADLQVRALLHDALGDQVSVPWQSHVIKAEVRPMTFRN